MAVDVVVVEAGVDENLSLVFVLVVNRSKSIIRELSFMICFFLFSLISQIRFSSRGS